MEWGGHGGGLAWGVIRRRARWLAAALAVASAVAGSGTTAQAQLPASTLAITGTGGPVVVWRSDRAPAQWAAPDERLLQALSWRAIAPGVEWATVPLEGTGEAMRLSLIVVRLAPGAAKARLAFPRPRGATWSVDSAPGTALVALNAGQFERDAPWGWVVSGGVVRWSPGRGPLSTAVAFDRTGRVQWIAGREVAMAARRHPPPHEAFQSYPTLLEDGGIVPLVLRQANALVSVGHRDARLAIGEDRTGTIVIAMTRFTALGETLGQLPFGLTTPEMSAIMGALGCRVAVALDGGTSAQLQVRESAGVVQRWGALRRVPMGLVFEAAGAPP